MFDEGKYNGIAEDLPQNSPNNDKGGDAYSIRRSDKRLVNRVYK